MNDSTLNECPFIPRRVMVVGGGAAGMMAAWRAAEAGHSVVLLEANPRLGAKVRISGGGKCNVTHNGSTNAFLMAFPKAQARFLRPALNAFTNEHLVELLRHKGVETYTRDNGRVFPLDRPGSSAAVLGALESLLRESRVEVRTGTRVLGLLGEAPRIQAVHLEGGGTLAADVFVLATGGASYPQTGTRGEALNWLRQLSIPVAPWFPALSPIPLQSPMPLWEGVALRGGALILRASKDGKRVAQHADDVLFTRTGLSGPAALELSQAAERQRRMGGAWLEYAFVNTPPEPLEDSLLELQRANPHLTLRNWLHQWIPQRIAESVSDQLGILKDQRLKDLSKDLRKRLLEQVLQFPLGEPASVPLTKGEVSAGGVRLDAVDPRTLLVKGWENLHVCGELLDIDGPIGGYNLQAAFSTGYLCGSLSK